MILGEKTSRKEFGLSLLLSVILMVFYSWVFMFCWNELIPSLFVGMPTMSFTQGLATILMINTVKYCSDFIITTKRGEN